MCVCVCVCVCVFLPPEREGRKPGKGVSCLAWAGEAPPTTRAPLPPEATRACSCRVEGVSPRGQNLRCPEASTLGPGKLSSMASGPSPALHPHPTPRFFCYLQFQPPSLIAHTSPFPAQLSPAPPCKPCSPATPGLSEFSSKSSHVQGSLPRMLFMALTLPNRIFQDHNWSSVYISTWHMHGSREGS